MKQATLSSASNDLDHARAVLAREEEGLRALAASLDERFVQAVECIAGLAGRVIVTGMGKSGHVARKIAATFASTGTPALFVHPAEASHGDLGMIGTEDAVLALSNSGETAELADIVAYTRRFRIPLIGIARRAGSRLTEAADIPLVLPDTPEASPVSAPTTSTTMMIALGDALAVALLERRGFTPEDFHKFHPGGKLGQAFLRVDQLMHGEKKLPLVRENQPMHEVLLEITAKSFGCAGVVNHAGALSGIITDGDLRRHMSPALLELPAHEVMTKNPVTIRPQALAAEALGLLNARNITSLFVVDDRMRPVGILHVHDCLRAGVA